MGTKAIGLLFLAAGLAGIGLGWLLLRRYRAESEYQGIGSFRITWGGVASYVGYLMVVFGTSSAGVGILLIFL